MSRIIKLKRENLIDKVKENLAVHQKEYAIAVIAFKLEVAEQLEKLTKLNSEGSLKIHLKLVIPVDNTKKYEKIIDMFEWEINDEVELAQSEFNEYIRDEGHHTISGGISNSAYSGKFGLR